jgi:hypothetical protein
LPTKYGAAAGGDILRNFTVPNRHGCPAKFKDMLRGAHRLPGRRAVREPDLHCGWVLSPGSTVDAGGWLMGLRRIDTRQRQCRSSHGYAGCADMPAGRNRRECRVWNFLVYRTGNLPSALCSCAPRRLPFGRHIRGHSPHPAVFDATARSCAAGSAAGSCSVAAATDIRRDGDM